MTIDPQRDNPSHLRAYLKGQSLLLREDCQDKYILADVSLIFPIISGLQSLIQEL